MKQRSKITLSFVATVPIFFGIAVAVSNLTPIQKDAALSHVDLNNRFSTLVAAVNANDAAIAGVESSQFLEATGVQIKAGSFTVAVEDSRKVFIMNNAATATVILPPALQAGSGFHITVKQNTGKAVIIDPSGSEMVDGYEGVSLNEQYAAIRLVSDGENWFNIFSAGVIENDLDPYDPGVVGSYSTFSYLGQTNHIQCRLVRLG